MFLFRASLFLTAWLLFAAIPLQAQPLYDTLVVCPDEFQPALKRWLEYRRGQGHSILVQSPAGSAHEIKIQIRAVASRLPLRSVFLIGDPGQQFPRPGVLLPTDYVDAKVNVLFGSEEKIATDNTFADLDDDGIPELALGRLPADSVEEVQRFLDRVIEYEQDRSPDQQWRRNVNFVAGIGGFGGLVDNVIEKSTKQIIMDLIPEDYRTSMTFGSWRSPYCPDPRRFSETAIRRFNEGCMFWIYIGHGRAQKLDRVYLPDQSHAILDVQSAEQIRCPHGSPIAIFLACYTGAADYKFDCLAETMIRQPRGPIAAICGSRVTMPYALSLMSLEMVDEYFEGDSQTLGELTLIAKQRLVNGDQQADEYRDMIHAMGKMFSPRPELLQEERAEHLHLIHLFGDPLLRLKRPQRVELSTDEIAESGRKFQVRGISPESGQMTVELVYCRDRFRERPGRRLAYDSSDLAFCEYQDAYEKAHDLTCCCKHVLVAKGPFEIELDVPAERGGVARSVAC